MQRLVLVLMLIACSKKTNETAPSPSASASITTVVTPSASTSPPKTALTADTVCARIVAAGLGAKCREVKPGGLSSAAIERYDFDLPSVPGKGGGVMRFDRESFYDNTEESYGRTAQFAGPHRYGSRKALIFVQANEGLSLENGKRLKALIELSPDYDEATSTKCATSRHDRAEKIKWTIIDRLKAKVNAAKAREDAGMMTGRIVSESDLSDEDRTCVSYDAVAGLDYSKPRYEDSASFQALSGF